MSKIGKVLLPRRALIRALMILGSVLVSIPETRAQTLQGIIVTFKGKSGGWRGVRPSLQGVRYRVRADYRHTNQVALDIEPRGVALLRAHPLVESIAPNGVLAPTLGPSR